MLYWRIGKTLAEKVIEEGGEPKTVERLSKDLCATLPEISGFSVRNLHYMRKFYESYTDGNCATAVAQIPWGVCPSLIAWHPLAISLPHDNISFGRLAIKPGLIKRVQRQSLA